MDSSSLPAVKKFVKKKKPKVVPKITPKYNQNGTLYTETQEKLDKWMIQKMMTNPPPLHQQNDHM